MSEQLPVLVRMIHLRFLVGALGERLGWWSSRFTDDVGLRRMATSFPRTSLRAALESVTIAARRDHDGKLHPDTVHLFRLDGAQEDAASQLLAGGTVQLQAPPATIEDILVALDAIGAPDDGSAPLGPCSLGKTPRTRLQAGVADLARVYAAAARSDRRAIPYFEVAG